MKENLNWIKGNLDVEVLNVLSLL